MELATLREIPRGNFIQSNALYGPSTLQVSQDDEMLPKLKRDQIILSRFLGSGAFGEVCHFRFKIIIINKINKINQAFEELFRLYIKMDFIFQGFPRNCEGFKWTWIYASCNKDLKKRSIVSREK